MEYTRQKGAAAWLKRYVSFSLIAALAVLSYLTFFTDNSVSTSYAQTLRNDSIRREIAVEEDSLRYYRQLNLLLTTDRNTMEGIVRERFHMQRPDEEVFLFE